jgi:hypothetical protein
MNRPNRLSLAILSVTGCAAGLGAAAAAWLVPRLIAAGWRGESWQIVNALFSGTADHPLEEYLADWHAVWPGLVLNAIGLGIAAAVLARPETWAVARRALGSTPRAAFHATPKLAVGVVLLSLAVGECYPFSHFPMYSSFGRQGAYVFLTKPTDEPIPSRRDTGLPVDAIQKIFVANLTEERARRGLASHVWSLDAPTPKDEVVEAAAVRTLQYLRDERFATHPALRLWRTRITLTNGTIQRERELLGEVPAGEGAGE